MSNTFDFIVVGGGISGSVLASRLADTATAPRVLLLEAGGPNDTDDVRAPACRYTLPFTHPTMNYQYQSVPQKHLNNRRMPYHRGRGLGGSSAINFCSWLLGHREDYNQWAELVGDDAWKWEGEGGVKQRFRKIENLHDKIEDKLEKYINRDALKEHSKQGRLDLSYDKYWSETDTLGLEAGIEFNGGINGDLNSGDPTGFGMAPSSYCNGLRSSAATAYLSLPPSNLVILTDSPVAKVIFDNSKKAIGVQIVSGQAYHASKEVIVSAGAIDSPKVLLLSGIGPANELSHLSVPVIHDLPGVGRNLRDHCFVTTTILRKHRNLPAEYDPHGTTGVQAPMAWLSSPAVKGSAEFAALDEATRNHLEKVPSFELFVAPLPLAGAPTPRENAEIFTFVAVIMNAKSTGSVKLASANPIDHPVIDSNYLSHPYDRRVVIEGLRSTIEYSKMPAFQAVTETRIEGPAGGSDEEIWEHCKKVVMPIWHFAGTCRMGKDKESVVDSEFKVRGIKGLRVVDHAIAPLMTNNHTQSTCYLIGETAAEKIVAEYDL